MADTNSILWQMADQIRARLGNADLYATKVSLATAVSEQIADTISDINNRMAVLEGGGGTQVPNLTSQPVAWTNLSEINLSGEKVTNGTFATSTTYEAGALLKVTSAFSQFSVGDELLLARVGADQNSYELKTETTVLWAGKTAVESNTDVLPALNFDSVTNLPTGSTTQVFKKYLKWMTATDSTKGLTQGRIYETKNYSPTNSVLKLFNDTGSLVQFTVGNQVRGTDWELMRGAPTNWDIQSQAGLDQEKLADGIIKGDGGAASIIQMFPQAIASGTKLVIKATRDDTNTQNISVQFLRANETPYSSYVYIDPAVGFAEFETTEITYGIRLNTTQTARCVSELSVFQGDKSGGTVQATTNTLQRISGTQGWNTGASSSQAIPGGQDGYFQFQYDGGSVRVGLTYQDVDFDEPTPQGYRLGLHGDGTVISDGYNSGADFALSGTWIRIRHYSGDNLIKFQKLQTIYEEDPDFVFPTTSGTNYTYQAGSEPIAVALQTAGGLTVGEYYKVKTIRDSDGAFQLRDFDDNVMGWQGASTRTTRWEVVEDVGQDYVTFHTATPLTTNSPLYLDTSLFHNGTSQINDATLVS